MRLGHLIGRDEPLAVIAGDRVAALGGRLDGVSTVDDVLARWPELREELEGAAGAALRDDSVALEPGDLILTGTPWGVGGFRTPPMFLEAGDVVEVEVEGVGVLSNPVAGATPA
jgi:hypothetical protein